MGDTLRDISAAVNDARGLHYLLRRLSAVRKRFQLGGSMGVYRKQGAWWIDWSEGTRRRRKKTAAQSQM